MRQTKKLQRAFQGKRCCEDPNNTGEKGTLTTRPTYAALPVHCPALEYSPAPQLPAQSPVTVRTFPLGHEVHEPAAKHIKHEASQAAETKA